MISCGGGVYLVNLIRGDVVVLVVILVGLMGVFCFFYWKEVKEKRDDWKGGEGFVC